MCAQKLTKRQTRDRRRARVRAKIQGNKKCPRLNVHRSMNNMYVQLIDDTAGKTLVSAHSKKDIDAKQDAGSRKAKIKQCYLLGLALAKKAKDKKISKAVFDRGGYKYHGRVKAVAEGARDGGLKF